jgi:hypothetical protein
LTQQDVDFVLDTYQVAREKQSLLKYERHGNNGKNGNRGYGDSNNFRSLVAERSTFTSDKDITAVGLIGVKPFKLNGSIIKEIVLVAATTDNVHTLDAFDLDGNLLASINISTPIEQIIRSSNFNDMQFCLLAGTSLATFALSVQGELQPFSFNMELSYQL